MRLNKVVKKIKLRSGKEISKGIIKSFKQSLSYTKGKTRKTKILIDIQNVLIEVKQARQGKIQLKTLREVLNEL
jgi:hypothetical protein